MGTGGLRDCPHREFHPKNPHLEASSSQKWSLFEHLCSRESLALPVGQGHCSALTCMTAVRQARVAEISSLAASRAVVFTLVSLVVWLKYWKSLSGASSLQMLPTMMLMTAKVPADSTGRSGAPSGESPVLEGSWAGAQRVTQPIPNPTPGGGTGALG